MNYLTLNDLYFHELRDLYAAEKELIRTLPKVIRHTSSGPLREAIEAHLEETRTHASRLEELITHHGRNTRHARCRGMEGIIEEICEWLDEEATAEVMDAGIIALLQRIEHYEIAGYGCARNYAGMLGFGEDEALLGETLEEEHGADSLLSEVAGQINEAAKVPLG